MVEHWALQDCSLHFAMFECGPFKAADCMPACLAACCVPLPRLLVPVPVQVACLALGSGLRSEQWTALRDG